MAVTRCAIALGLMFLAGCESFGTAVEVAGDPAVQEAGRKVVNDALSGDWIGAGIGAVSMAGAIFAAWKGRAIAKRVKDAPPGRFMAEA